MCRPVHPRRVSITIPGLSCLLTRTSPERPRHGDNPALSTFHHEMALPLAARLSLSTRNTFTPVLIASRTSAGAILAFSQQSDVRRELSHIRKMEKTHRRDSPAIVAPV